MMNVQRRLGRSWPAGMLAVALAGFLPAPKAQAQKLEPVHVEGQPLAANVNRLLDALQFLGAPLPEKETAALRGAAKARDAAKVQKLLDPHVLVAVTLNPESRVKVARGPAEPISPARPRRAGSASPSATTMAATLAAAWTARP